MNTVVGVKAGGEPDIQERNFDLNSDDDVAGGGMPMSTEYLIDRIRKYNEQRLADYQKAQKDNDPTAMKLIGDENVAIVLGKESLMLLLSQKECAGIRFYFCKNPYGRNSVAAVGVRVVKNGDDHEEAQDIGLDPESKELSILSLESLQTTVLNSEVGPPNTFKDFFKPTENNPRFMAEMKSILFK